MGSVGEAMDQVIAATAQHFPAQLAFHTASQAADFQLSGPPTLLANGFDFSRYSFNADPQPCLGWVGRIAPEKGLEDAACLLYTSPSPRDRQKSRMPSSA